MKKLLDGFNSLETDKSFVVDQLSGKFSVNEVDADMEEDPEGEKTAPFVSKDFAPTENTLSCFQMASNGRGIYTGGMNGRVIMRKVCRPKKVLTHAQLHTHVRALALTADQKLLFTGGSDHLLKMVKGNDLSTVLETFRATSRVLCLCLYENKKFLFCGSYTGRIFAWKYSTGKDLPHFRTPRKQHERLVYCLRIIGGDDAATLVSTSEDKTIKQWRISTGEQVAQLTLEFPAYNIRVLKNGKWLTQNFKDTEMWNNKKNVMLLDGLEKEHIFVNVTSFDVTPNQKILLGWNRLLGRFEFWDIENKIQLFDIRLYDTVFLSSLTHVQKSQKKLDAEPDDFYMYYITGKSLGRTEVKYSDLLKKHETSNLYNIKQAYLSYEELFRRATETFTYSKVEAAQAIQDCFEKKLLTPGLPLDVQINRFFDYFNSKVKVEYEDDYKKKLRKIALEKVAFQESVLPNDEGKDTNGEVMFTEEQHGMDLRGRKAAFLDKAEKLLKDGKFTLIIQKTNILGDALSIFHSQFEARKYCKDTMVCFTTASNKGFEKISDSGFFEILCEKILELLFVPCDGIPYFNTANGSEDLEQTLKFLTLPELYLAAGRVIGYCLFHDIRIPFHVPLAVYKMLLGIPIVYEDLQSVYPYLYKCLDEILTSEDEDREISNVLPGGGEEAGVDFKMDINLNSMEKYAFTKKYALFHLLEKNRENINSFVKGFREIAGDFMGIFKENEMEVLLCGFKKIDISLWKSNCIFSKCTKESDIIRWFFEVIKDELTFKEQAALFHLITDEHSISPKNMLEPIPLVIIVELRNLANKIKGIKCNSVYNTVELPKYFSKFQLSENLKRLLQENEETQKE